MNLFDCVSIKGQWMQCYEREALVVVDSMSRVWMVHFINCKCFSVVIDHAALTHLLKQPIDMPTYQQVHCVEPPVLFAQCASILYC